MHTPESLMALVEDYARKREVITGMCAADKALQTAITEVFAALAEAQEERDLFSSEAVQWKNDWKAESDKVDTLQSKCDEQAREIENLKAYSMRERSLGAEGPMIALNDMTQERDSALAKIAEMEKQITEVRRACDVISSDGFAGKILNILDRLAPWCSATAVGAY